MGLYEGIHNGTIIADLCYKDGERFRKIGSLIYFRTHDAEIRLDLIPLRPWVKGEDWFFGNFITSEKVEEPPYIEGDITAPTEERGKRVQVGHIHTQDNEVGDTQYILTLFGVPVGIWRKAIMENEETGSKRSLFMKIEMEDK